MTNVGDYIPSGFSMPRILSFKSIENKHKVYRGNNGMKTFFESLAGHAWRQIILKRKN